MAYLERKNPANIVLIDISEDTQDSEIINIEAFGGGMGLGFDANFDGTVISYKVPINGTDFNDATNFKVFNDLAGALITQVVAASTATYADPRVMVFPALIIRATTVQAGNDSVITCFPLS